MKKVVISVLGHDRPGIVAAVSQTLLENRCNIEDVSQTILQTEFAGIFIAGTDENCQLEDLRIRLAAKLNPMGLSVLMKEVEEGKPAISGSAEPFVITTLGPDRLGLVAGITEVLLRFGVNITNLKAVFRGGEDPRRNVMIYEVDVPAETNHQDLREALQGRAQELSLDISVQHRDIFEAIHRI